MLQVGRASSEQPRGRGRDQLLPVDVGQQVERGGVATRPQRGEQRVEPLLRHQRAIALDVTRQIRERSSVPGQRQPHVEHGDAIQRVEELADRVGRPAVVEVERDAAEHVVAGEQQAPLRLVEHDVRRRVALGVSITLHGPRSVSTTHALEAGPAPAAAGRSSRCSRRAGPPPTPAAAPPARRSGGRPRSAARAPPRGRRTARSGARDADGSTARSARPLLDRERPAAVVGVGVRADDQADVLDLPADLRERPLEIAHRPAPAQAADRTARSRRRPRPPRRCRAARPATAAARAAARRRGSPARRAPPPSSASACAPRGRYRRAHGRRRTLRRRDLLRGTDRARRRGGRRVLGAPAASTT